MPPGSRVVQLPHHPRQHFTLDTTNLSTTVITANIVWFHNTFSAWYIDILFAWYIIYSKSFLHLTLKEFRLRFSHSSLIMLLKMDRRLLKMLLLIFSYYYLKLKSAFDTKRFLGRSLMLSNLMGAEGWGPVTDGFCAV